MGRCPYGNWTFPADKLFSWMNAFVDDVAILSSCQRIVSSAKEFTGFMIHLAYIVVMLSVLVCIANQLSVTPHGLLVCFSFSQF